MPSTLVNFEEEALIHITLVFDSDGTKGSLLQDFIGLYGIPQEGGWYWWSIKNECGSVEDAKEAVIAIRRSAK